MFFAYICGRIIKSAIRMNYIEKNVVASYDLESALLQTSPKWGTIRNIVVKDFNRKYKMQLKLLLLLLIITFSGCKKYEEGPTISFRSKKSRIVGNWNVEVYANNFNLRGTSYNDQYFICHSGFSFLCTESYQTTKFNMCFYKSGDYNWERTLDSKNLNTNSSYNSCTPVYTYTSLKESESGKWRFQGNNMKIEISNFKFYNGEYDYLATYAFDIIKLKENEVKLKYYIGKVYWTLNLVKI